MVGEMIISSSMMIETCRKQLGYDDDVVRNTEQLEQISREVRDMATSLRLVPISGVFQKMSRIAFEAGNKLGKKVRLEIEGESTELDRTVFERIIDPLMHMVRNSIAHGIEEPSARVSAGKEEAGLVKLSAMHYGDNIRVKVIDDGQGLDVSAIKKRAIEKGLIDANVSLSDSEIYKLIFEPGFSTADKVSDIAGRGVGMDVVKKNIESMRGRILINSEVGKGTEFTIELPLTLGIVDGILVRVGVENYILPMVSIVEFLEADRQEVHRVVGEGCLIKYRDSIVPVYSMKDIFESRNSFSQSFDGVLVISERDGAHTAFQVDEILGTCSTIIKSVKNSYRSVPGVAGAAILADGRASLILDLGILASAARNLSFASGGGESEPGRV